MFGVLDLMNEFIYAYLYIIGLVLGAGCLIMIVCSIVCLILMLIFGLVLGAAILFIKIFLFFGIELDRAQAFFNTWSKVR